jgi:hypothetical protein
VPRYVKDLIGLDTSAFCVTDKYDFVSTYSKVGKKRRASRAIEYEATGEKLFDPEPNFTGIV